MSSSVNNVQEFLSAVLPALKASFKPENQFTYADKVDRLRRITFFNPSVPVFIKGHDFVGDRTVNLQYIHDEFVQVSIEDKVYEPRGDPSLNWDAKFVAELAPDSDGKLQLVPGCTLNHRHTRANWVCVYDAPNEKRQFYQGQFAGTVDALIAVLNQPSLATQPYVLSKA